jgi:hypothetical protein
MPLLDSGDVRVRLGDTKRERKLQVRAVGLECTIVLTEPFLALAQIEQDFGLLLLIVRISQLGGSDGIPLTAQPKSLLPTLPGGLRVAERLESHEESEHTGANP